MENKQKSPEKEDKNGFKSSADFVNVEKEEKEGKTKLAIVSNKENTSISEPNIPTSSTFINSADEDKNGTSHAHDGKGGDFEYESEPTLHSKRGSHQKRFKGSLFRSNQGKTMYPKSKAASKEIRELRRSDAILEKNLKIEGLPEPQKITRKRRYSVGSGTGRPYEKESGFKRKRLGSVDRKPRKDHMPKWELHGGDAGDPLNLNGLRNSEEGRLLNLKTPESSPMPMPEFRGLVRVRVPPNIEDPLNLEGKHDQRVIDKMLDATIKKRHRPKKKHDKQNIVEGNQKANASESSETNNCSNVSIESVDTSIETTPVVSKNAQSEISDCDMASPVATTPIKSGQIITPPMQGKSTTPTKQGKSNIPFKPGPPNRRSFSTSPDRKFKRQTSGGKGKSVLSSPKKYPENPMFVHGNYNRYYGYRNKDHEPDIRLQHFNPSWFKGKDVLDIGCNVGHVTLALAEKFLPNKILGMDIDGKLIRAARQNIRHMLSLQRKDSSKFPSVFEQVKGPLEAHPLMGKSKHFPNNVLFLQGNYVPVSEDVLELQKEEYDTILALSITKWIHLNNGDFGLKLFFRKIFRQLRPGGHLILEPQPWATYRKRAKLTADMFDHYRNITLKPEGFKHYLLSIGFVKCEVIGVPVAKAKGFRRPLIVFTKADSKQTLSSMMDRDQIKEDICTACGSKNPTSCVHEFTGIRTGAYADYMYDHVNYPQVPTDYSDPGSRGYYSYNQCNMLAAEYANIMGCGSASYYSNYPLVPQSQRLRSESSRGSSPYRGASEHGSRVGSTTGESGKGSSMSESGTSTGSSSERSWTSSFSSGTGSSRSTTGSSRMSSRSTASSAYSPIDNGPNGDIAQDAFWHEAALNAGIVPNDQANQSMIDQLEDGGLAQEVEWVENPNAVEQEFVEPSQEADDADIEMSENNEAVGDVGNSSSVCHEIVGNNNTDVSITEPRDISLDINDGGNSQTTSFGDEHISSDPISADKLNDSREVTVSENISIDNSTFAPADTVQPISSEENIQEHYTAEKIEECTHKILLDKQEEDPNRKDIYKCSNVIGAVSKDGDADTLLSDSMVRSEKETETDKDVDEPIQDTCQTDRVNDKSESDDSKPEPS